MHRLQSELARLYLPHPSARSGEGSPAAALIDTAGRVRALVLELTRPPSWEPLSRVWTGVQSDLDLPAPAIAVSGTDGLQLWFSLVETVTLAQAQAFLEGLRLRYLADTDARRVRRLPAAGDAGVQHARPVPAEQEGSGNWSAFVAPDLAPVFGDTPWLDIPPGEEGQANLLRGIAVMTPAAFAAAMEQLQATTPPSPAPVATAVTPPAPHEHPVASPTGDTPQQFLLRVMQDETVALPLRIEAAKALLQHEAAQRG